MFEIAGVIILLALIVIVLVIALLPQFLWPLVIVLWVGNRCGAHRRACRPLVRSRAGDFSDPEPRLGIPLLARRGQGALGRGLELS